MNQKNVAAIRAILDEAVAEMRRQADATYTILVGDYQTDLLAEVLASRGVLVPATLTNGECGAVRGISTERYEGFLLEAEMRAALERIARGEPPAGDP